MRLRMRRNLEVHKLTVSVDESEVLKRVALLNAALFKLIEGATLLRVTSADYKRGLIVALIRVDISTIPAITPGEVSVRIEQADPGDMVLCA